MPTLNTIVKNFHTYKNDRSSQNKQKKFLSLLQLLNYRMLNFDNQEEIIRIANTHENGWGNRIMSDLDTLSTILQNSKMQKFNYLKLSPSKQESLGIRKITDSLWPGETELFPLTKKIQEILGNKPFKDAYESKRKKSNLFSFLFKKRSSRKRIISNMETALNNFFNKPNETNLNHLKTQITQAQAEMATEQKKRSYFKKSSMLDLTTKIDRAIESFNKAEAKNQLSLK